MGSDRRRDGGAALARTRRRGCPPLGRLRDYAGTVIEFDDVQDLVSPVVIAAFEGWNDAADAASSVVDHLMEVWNAQVVGAIDPEEFYDFQVNRPLVGTDEQRPPAAHVAHHPDRDRLSPGPGPRRRS